MNTANDNFSRAELDKFDELAQRWWDPDGPQKALHALNPARLRYVAERVALADATVLDVGCGGGLLSEAMAKAGAAVTGVDLAPNLLKAARLHGLESGVKVDYRETSVEALADALIALAEDAPLRARLGARGRELCAERFRHENMTARLRVLYEEVLAKHGS